MRADLQERIAPAMPNGTQTFSEAQVDQQSDAKDSTGGVDRTDFRTLLTNSNDETKKKREAKQRGDFSESKSEQDFLQDLAEQSKPKREIRNTLNKDDFLHLFVEQLKHQDPMNPDDGAEMASKLAQFNSLEQMLNVNTTLNKMLESQNADRSLQMVNYVGKEISLDGGRLRLANGKPTSPSEYSLEAGAQKVTVQIRDGAGIAVRELELGSLPAGTHTLAWDGLDKKGARAGDGVYSYFVSAKNANGVDIPVKLSTKAKITGVDVKDQKGAVYTDFGRVKMDEIASVGMSGYQDVKVAGPAAVTSPQNDGNGLGMAAKTTPTSEELERRRAEGQLALPGMNATPTTAAGIEDNVSNPASAQNQKAPTPVTASAPGKTNINAEKAPETSNLKASTPTATEAKPKEASQKSEAKSSSKTADDAADKDKASVKKEETAASPAASDKKAQRENRERTKNA